MSQDKLFRNSNLFSNHYPGEAGEKSQEWRDEAGLGSVLAGLQAASTTPLKVS